MRIDRADMEDIALMLLTDEGDSGPLVFLMERSVDSDFSSARERCLYMISKLVNLMSALSRIKSSETMILLHSCCI